MSYNLQQLLSGAKAVCRNGRVPSIITYYPDTKNVLLPDGVLVIQVHQNKTYGSIVIVLNAATGKRFISDSDFDLLLTDEPATAPVITIPSGKVGYVNLYESDKTVWGSFVYQTKSDADANAAPTRINTATIIY